MSKDLSVGDKHQLQLIIEHLKAIVVAIEALVERRVAAEAFETLHIKGLNQNQILQAVAKKRIAQYPTLHTAAESLGIDVRTLKRYAADNETDDE